MKIAIVTSNSVSIKEDARKGTEIFSYSLIHELSKISSSEELEITAFASGDSKLPVRIESINYLASSEDKTIPEEKYIIFELALISKAFSKHKELDLYHINIGDGDIILPFSGFIKKPIIITLHNTQGKPYIEKYFSFFKDNPNLFFISISNVQRNFFPKLNYLRTIYHGIDTKVFEFNKTGGEAIMWAGRAIPEKGIDKVVEIALFLKKETKLFGFFRSEYQEWLGENVLDKINPNVPNSPPISLEMDKERLQLISHFQTSKLFLFPVDMEESFGLVLVEAMSCGTPIVAFAKGSIPEVIKDGVTGFIINSSEDDIRGNWIIKKTGIEGLIEAVERIYSMPENEYLAMRQASRDHVEEHFTIEKMTKNYIEAYKMVNERLGGQLQKVR